MLIFISLTFCSVVSAQANPSELMKILQTVENSSRAKGGLGNITPNVADTVLNASNVASVRTGPLISRVSSLTVKGGNDAKETKIPSILKRPTSIQVEFNGDFPRTDYCNFSFPPDGQRHFPPEGCNDKVSGVTVPIGMTARICEHDGQGSDGEGLCRDFGGGTSYVGNDLNDQGTSFFVSDNGSYFYLTTADDEVPSALNVGVTWTSNGDGKNGGFSVSITASRDWYTKSYSIPLPDWCAHPDVFESTKANDAEWKSTISSGILKIEMRVRPRLPFSSNNWVGVGVRCNP